MEFDESNYCERNRIDVGHATIKCIGRSDDGFPIWALPGRKTTESRGRATTAARRINQFMIEVKLK